MIVRIVQMTFNEASTAAFTALFDARRHTIRSFPGCTHLELWQDSKQPNVFFTCSHWETEADLNHYRFSDFFKDTWGTIKPMFIAKPQAWSLFQLTPQE